MTGHRTGPHEAVAGMHEAAAAAHEAGADGCHFKAGSDRNRSKARADRNGSESDTAEVSRRHRTRDDGLSHDHAWPDDDGPDDCALYDGPPDDNARSAN
jgi:hypothetical protein